MPEPVGYYLINKCTNEITPIFNGTNLADSFDIVINGESGECKLSCEDDIMYATPQSGEVLLNGTPLIEQSVIPINGVLDFSDHQLVLKYNSNEQPDPTLVQYLAATTDELSGVPNSLSFKDRVNEKISFALRNSFPMSLIIIDADNFAEYCRQVSQDDADAAICEMAQLICKTKREEDVITRLEGACFALFLLNTDAKTSYTIATRIRENACNLQLHSENNQDFNLCVSLGICYSGNTSALTLENFMKQAKDALAQARENGHGQISQSDYIRVI